MQIETALQKIWDSLVAIFMAPGEAMMHSLANTPWGADWGVPADEWTINMGVSVIFWCIVFSLANAMDDHIRRFTSRNRRRVS